MIVSFDIHILSYISNLINPESLSLGKLIRKKNESQRFFETEH